MRDSAVWRRVWIVTSPVVILARSSARSNTFRIVVYGFLVLEFVKTQGMNSGSGGQDSGIMSVTGIRLTYPFFVDLHRDFAADDVVKCEWRSQLRTAQFLAIASRMPSTRNRHSLGGNHRLVQDPATELRLERLGVVHEL